MFPLENVFVRVEVDQLPEFLEKHCDCLTDDHIHALAYRVVESQPVESHTCSEHNGIRVVGLQDAVNDAACEQRIHQFYGEKQGKVYPHDLPKKQGWESKG